MRERLLPWPLLAGLIAAGGAAGGVTLDRSDSGPAALMAAAAVSWGGVLIARAVRGGRDSRELLSHTVDAGSGRRAYATRIVPLLAFVVAVGVIAGLLSAFGIDTPKIAGLDASAALAFVLAVPVWLDVDARMSARAARKRAEEEGRLRDAAEPGRGVARERDTTREEWKARSRAARLHAREEAAETAELPAGGWRAWALTLLLLGGGLAAASLVALGTGGLDRVLGAAVGLFLVVLAVLLLRRLVGTPYFARLTATGIDLMGAGEIPWEAIAGVDVTAEAGLKFLELRLRADVPNAEPWYTRRHAWMSRRLGDLGLSVTLLFSAKPAEVVVRAIRARTGAPVYVDLDA